MARPNSVVPNDPDPQLPPTVRQRNSALEAAGRRIQESMERYREALEEVRRHHHACSREPLCDHADKSCAAHALGNLCQSFLLSFGVRVGIGVLLRAFNLARSQSYSSILDLKQLVSEENLIVREEACRIGMLLGGFTGSYHALRCFLRKIRRRETPLNVILAGSVAGLSILALDDPSRRRTLALYLLARLAQCAYNSAKSRNMFHLWGSHWRHGDSLLFSLACAQGTIASLSIYFGTIDYILDSLGLLKKILLLGFQVHLTEVMYAFIMWPESLPKTYQYFIQRTGPVAEPVYKAVRECCRGGPVDIVSLSAYLSNKKRFTTLNLENPSIIPCTIIHPNSNSCLAHTATAVSETFRKIFPLYFSLMIVPFVVLHLRKFLESPAWTSWGAVQDAVRSTTFLSAFVGAFQGVICLHRKVATKDHKLIYWFAGAISAFSVLLQNKSRRAELALYVLPRAVNSLWYISVNRHSLPDIKYAEVALFCICMGGIMFFLEHEPDTMAPPLRRLISRFLASRINSPSSSAYLRNLGTDGS